jgi:hypothetical protein
MLYIEEGIKTSERVLFINQSFGMGSVQPANDELFDRYSIEEIEEAFSYAVEEKFVKDNGVDGGYLIAAVLPEGQKFLLNVHASREPEPPKRTIGF